MLGKLALLMLAVVCFLGRIMHTCWKLFRGLSFIHSWHFDRKTALHILDMAALFRLSGLFNTALHVHLFLKIRFVNAHEWFSVQCFIWYND